MAKSRIVYNSKTIDIGKAPRRLIIEPKPPRDGVNTTLTGSTETTVLPRVDTRVHVEIIEINSATSRYQLENWWQWALRGGLWTYAVDSSKTVYTVLAAAASAGASSVVVLSATGIVSGQKYALIQGSQYQVITVSGIAGTTISFSETLDGDLGPYGFDSQPGAIFRDLYFWYGELRDLNPQSPFDDHDAPDGQIGLPLHRFNLTLDFCEQLQVVLP